MRALGDALEFAMVACAWLRNEYVRDYVATNRVVLVRLSEAYTDGRRLRRRRTVYVPRTMAQITALAADVIGSRHAC